MREIVLDTETTGLDPKNGHKIIEIGCVELVNYLPSGREFQTYINPQRDIPNDASAISGITSSHVADKPLFGDIANSFLQFIGDSPLVIHNAAFDIKFLNYELNLIGKNEISFSRAIDTLLIARQLFPGSPASLDALCNRFQIDTSARVKHGAIIDCHLLAEVYLNLLGGKQTKISFSNSDIKNNINASIPAKIMRKPREHFIAENELIAHKEFISQIQEPIWDEYQ